MGVMSQICSIPALLWEFHRRPPPSLYCRWDYPMRCPPGAESRAAVGQWRAGMTFGEFAQATFEKYYG